MPWRRLMTDAPFEGIFRRQIDLKAWDERTVVGWLEDESHHFGITLIHDGTRVRDLRVATPRHPWSTCADAGTPLRALIGQPLVHRCSAIGTLLDMQLQCTHLFDLTGLALAHAHARRHHRRYHGIVQPLADLIPDAPAAALRATLLRDGSEVLAWNLVDDTITAPAPYTGRSIFHGFREWSDTLEVDAAEKALVLRRVAFVAGGRRIDLKRARVAADMDPGPVCHTFQPEFRGISVRIRDAQLRFDDCPESMLRKATDKP